jgi:hypothetical protein
MPLLTFLPPDRHHTPGQPARDSGRWTRIRHAAAELTPDAIEQIAQRVAQLLHHEPPDEDRPAEAARRLMDASQLARHLGLTRAWVYEHASELGAIRIGTGPRARLRFDLNTAVAALDAHHPRESPSVPRPPRAPSTRPRPKSPAAPLLPIRPRRVRGVLSRLSPSRRNRRW